MDHGIVIGRLVRFGIVENGNAIGKHNPHLSFITVVASSIDMNGRRSGPRLVE